MQKKLLCIVHHRYNRSPGQRFRIEQFIPKLKENNWQVEYSNILNQEDDKLFYSSGRYFSKFWIMLKSIRHRFLDLRRISDYDMVFIYREAIMIGSSWFEKRIGKKDVPVIYDFDDSISLLDTSKGNENLSWLKKPDKVKDICRYATCVTVGNKYLADFAKQYNDKVEIIPTVVNTDYHKPIELEKESEEIVIGWTGTQPTLKHFETALPFLREISTKYGKRVSFKVVVNFPYSVEDLPLEVVQWNKEDEIQELCKIDIGIMPLPNDKWSKGKCGFKGLQYMALEIPTIMSPVGVNVDIINDGVNGYLADTDGEWVEKLSRLIEDVDLRSQIGKAGRQTILESYSRNAIETEFLNVLERNLVK